LIGSDDDSASAEKSVAEETDEKRNCAGLRVIIKIQLVLFELLYIIYSILYYLRNINFSSLEICVAYRKAFQNTISIFAI
jgi:CRISPR/Cas system-associated protein Cas10 (large subunit of type III CRISPR-Cas system)